MNQDFISINLSFPLPFLLLPLLPSFLLSISPSSSLHLSIYLIWATVLTTDTSAVSPQIQFQEEMCSVGERWPGLWCGLGQSAPGSELCLQLSHHRLGPRSTCSHMPGLVHLLSKARTCSGLFSKYQVKSLRRWELRDHGHYQIQEPVWHSR